MQSPPPRPANADQIDLRQVFGTLRRYAPLLILTPVVVAGAAYLLSSRQAPVYESSASIIAVDSNAQNSLINNTLVTAPPLPQGGCRLDAGSLEQAVLRVVEALEAPADLVLLSKFGRQEAAGRGLRPAFARALESGAPIITTVTPEWAADFAAFSDGLAEAVAPRDLLAWAEAAAR